MLSKMIACGLLGVAMAQQPGHQTKNVKPNIQYQTCTAPGQCTSETGTVVLDGNWMWTHKVGTYTNCYTGDEWDQTACPDPVSCARNCALDGGDYESTYGIAVQDDELSLKFVTKNPTTGGQNVGSRTYLMDTPSTYKMFMLKNREFTVDTDVSQLPCGLNGALYFVQMDQDGGMAKYPNNKAGAAYGTGYCDAQCPHDIKFINGEANILHWNPDPNDKNSGVGAYGTCCTEMDIWESNKIAQAVTPHSCTQLEQYRCNGTECGDDSSGQRDAGVCDKDGADFNPYRNGDKTFFGPGSDFVLDSTQKVTVVTQFRTVDNTDTGDLETIVRIYKQNGKVVATRPVNMGGTEFAVVNDAYADAKTKYFNDTDSFQKRGGMKQMGDAMEKGMVLVMSLWADYAVNMLWLDAPFPPNKDPSAPGVTRGSCGADSGKPADVIANNPDATVKYSNIRFGPIGSTIGPVGPTPPTPPSPPSPPPAPGGNVCADPGTAPACNTCSDCCHSFIPAGAACDECVKEKCAPAPTCATGSSCTTTCTACCVDYLPTAAACEGCIKSSCPSAAEL